MFRNTSITVRFVVTTALAITLVLSLTFYFVFQHMKGMLTEAEKEGMAERAENILTEVEAEGLRAQSMAALVAGIPQVQKAFAERDRETLKSYFAEGYEELKKTYGARQFQFHEPPAKSFLRVHKLEKFGDDLSSFRLTVVETNSSKTPIKGLEVGVAGLGVRGIVPVFYQKQHVGSVEFGMSFGQAFFDRMAAKHHIDLALEIQREGKMEHFASTLGEQSLLSDAEKGQAMEQGSLFRYGELGDKPIDVYATVVKSYSGKPIGILTVAQDRTLSVEALGNLRNMVLLLAVISGAVLVLLVAFISNGVVKPLRQAARQMQDIAYGSGNLSDRLDQIGSDEIAVLAKAYNAFVSKIEEIVGSIITTSNNLAVMANEFSELADHTNKGVYQQKDQITLVATAMTEMSATVQEVAQNTVKTADAASDVDKQAIAGQKVVTDAMESINRLAEVVGKAAQTVRQVEADSERIGSVLDVIRGIADQTNLLALNAAIEAARAGEQGRGFAVVADEVRTLAQRTQDSTQEIHDMIANLQHGVQNSVTVMESSQRQAQNSVDQAASAHQALVAITRSIDTITMMSSQIATAAEEQSAVAEDINRNIVDITDVAQRTAVDAEQTSNATDRLADSVEHLVHLMGQFRTGNRYANELQRAKASHLAWKGKLRSFLDGRGSIDEEVAFSHHKCGFGKWYDSVGLSELGHLRELREIEGPHKTMHETIKRVVQLKDQGDLEAAEREFEKVAPLSEEIVSRISALEQKV